MNKIPPKISNETFEVVEPDLHDGSLLGIVACTNDRVELKVSDVEDRPYRIVLDGVVGFVANNFRSGNIIFDLTVVQGENVQFSNLAALAHPGEKLAEPYLRKLHDQIVRESLYLVQLNPSYGCELTCIAKQVWFESIQAD